MLDCVDPKILIEANEEKKVGEIIENFPEPNCSLLCWLLDICVDVTDNSKINSMNERNLAIVISPNLYRTEKLDPTKLIICAQKFMNFMLLAIL